MSDWQLGRWWRVVLSDGTIWCETSEEQEARGAVMSAPQSATLQRQLVKTEVRWENQK